VRGARRPAGRLRRGAVHTRPAGAGLARPAHLPQQLHGLRDALRVDRRPGQAAPRHRPDRRHAAAHPAVQRRPAHQELPLDGLRDGPVPGLRTRRRDGGADRRPGPRHRRAGVQRLRGLRQRCVGAGGDAGRRACSKASRGARCSRWPGRGLQRRAAAAGGRRTAPCRRGLPQHHRRRRGADQPPRRRAGGRPPRRRLRAGQRVAAAALLGAARGPALRRARCAGCRWRCPAPRPGR
jgi:hypothetical protein